MTRLNCFRSTYRTVPAVALAVAALAVPSMVHGALIAHWPFDGDVTSSVGSFTSTATGGAVIDGAVARVGSGSLALDGAGDYVDISGALSELGGIANWTVAGFVKLDTANGAFSSILTTNVWALQNVHFNINHISNPDAVELAINTTGTTIAGSTSLNAATEWQHVAATSDGATTRLYLNGTQIATGSSSTVNFVDALGFARIGSWAGDAARDFEGHIDDLRIYDTELTSLQVEALAALPEPSTFLMALAGLLGLISCGPRRRRRRIG